MTRSQRRAFQAFVRARQTGAPYTTKRHPLHAPLMQLQAGGVMRSTRIARRFYWFEV